MSQPVVLQKLSVMQSIITATILVSTILFVSTSVLTWIIVGGVLNSLGVGLFCAFWGGPGFGVIAGGAAYSLAAART